MPNVKWYEVYFIFMGSVPFVTWTNSQIGSHSFTLSENSRTQTVFPLYITLFTFHFICSYNAVEFVHNSKFAPTAYTAGRLIQNSTPDTLFDTLLSSQQCLQLQNKLQQIWHTRIQQRGTAAFCFAYRFFTRNDLPLQTDCYIPQLPSLLLSHCIG